MRTAKGNTAEGGVPSPSACAAGAPPLWTLIIKTPLGDMEAYADSKALYGADFADYEDSYGVFLRRRAQPLPAGKNNAVLALLAAELSAYFDGQSALFTVPLYLTPHRPFSRAAWAALLSIPPGQTRCYAEQAALMGRTRNFSRAVAMANSRNPFPIIVPCHRVIAADGLLSGYGGGVWRKQWLLAHERHYFAA